MGNKLSLIQHFNRSLSLFLWLVIPAVVTHANFAKPAIAQFDFEAVENANSACPPPVLERLQRHRITTGETVESIAKRYNLLSATLIRLNPVLSRGSAPVGREILIPPLNGTRVEVPVGTSWQDLATTYGMRADLLFEINGCQTTPKVVFIPGFNRAAGERPAVDTYTGLAGYPLPSVAPVGLAYGWQPNSATEQRAFHSGIDLLTELGTPVLSANAGTVAFAGQQGNYGNLVVVNHQGGRQTRYAHLGRVKVAAGQAVELGYTLGTVGSTGSPDIDLPHLHFEVRYNTPSGWVAQDPEIHFKAKPAAQR